MTDALSITELALLRVADRYAAGATERQEEIGAALRQVAEEIAKIRAGHPK